MSIEQLQFDEEDIRTNTAIAALSNIPILFWLPFAAAKDSKFALHYANQGLWFLLISIANSIFTIIPVIGWIVAPIISLGLSVLIILGIVFACQGKAYKYPIIDDYKIIK